MRGAPDRPSLLIVNTHLQGDAVRPDGYRIRAWDYGQDSVLMRASTADWIDPGDPPCRRAGSSTPSCEASTSQTPMAAARCGMPAAGSPCRRASCGGWQWRACRRLGTHPTSLTPVAGAPPAWVLPCGLPHPSGARDPTRTAGAAVPAELSIRVLAVPHAAALVANGALPSLFQAQAGMDPRLQRWTVEPIITVCGCRRALRPSCHC
jgi:hypothetical protein